MVVGTKGSMSIVSVAAVACHKWNELFLILAIVSLEMAVKRVVSEHVKKKGGLPDLDFIDRALQIREAFETKRWPRETSLSLQSKLPLIGVYGNDDYVDEDDTAIEKFFRFCRNHDHRPLPRLNAENTLKAMPRKEALEALRKKFPGECTEGYVLSVVISIKSTSCLILVKQFG